MRGLKRKNINFYELYTAKPKTTEKRAINWKVLGAVVGVVVIGLMTGLFFLSKKQLETANQEVAQLKRQTKNEQMLKEIEQAKWLSERITVYEQILTAQQGDMDSLQQASEAQENISENLIAKVLSCKTPGLTVVGLSCADGFLYIDVTVARPQQAAEFITRLKALKLFSNVNYSGYTGEEGAYAFTAVARF